jgi:histidine triad (HIT) family protein
MAFLDLQPLAKGHTLVIPKKEVDFYYDLEDDLFEKVNALSKKVAHALQKTISCERIGFSVIGLEVPHAHVHLVPINAISDLNFTRERIKLTSDEFQELAKEIAANL